MLLFPNCKINIGLNIVSRRGDGYHNLETIFYPIYQLYDALEVLPAAETRETDKIENEKIASDTEAHSPSFTIHHSRFTLSGLPVAGDPEKNLCVKAYGLLKKDFPDLPAIHCWLHKNIPMGAGLGGGSADGAFMLRLLNEKFHLKLLQSQLQDYALQLGSDCPFFILNKPCFAEGRGEMLEEIQLNLAGYSIILIHPGIHVSTAEAFAGITPAHRADDLRELITQPIGTWGENIVNDFETSVFARHPLLGEIKQKLYKTGAVYAAMSGSGSTVYGIYPATGLPAEKLFPAFTEVHAAL